MLYRAWSETSVLKDLRFNGHVNGQLVDFNLDFSLCRVTSTEPPNMTLLQSRCINAKVSVMMKIHSEIIVTGISKSNTAGL